MHEIASAIDLGLVMIGFIVPLVPNREGPSDA
jgi:hypothetical protein